MADPIFNHLYWKLIAEDNIKHHILFTSTFHNFSSLFCLKYGMFQTKLIHAITKLFIHQANMNVQYVNSVFISSCRIWIISKCHLFCSNQTFQIELFLNKFLFYLFFVFQLRVYLLTFLFSR